MELPEAVKEIIRDNINSQFVPMLLAAPQMLERLKKVTAILEALGDSDFRKAIELNKIAINQAEGITCE